MTRTLGLLTVSFCALLSACAASPIQGSNPGLAQDSVTTAPETAACLARSPSVELAQHHPAEDKTVLDVDHPSGDARIEVAPDAAGSRVTYDGPGAPPKAVTQAIHRCTIAP
jgi:hypothetical protein